MQGRESAMPRRLRIQPRERAEIKVPPLTGWFPLEEGYKDGLRKDDDAVWDRRGVHYEGDRRKTYTDQFGRRRLDPKQVWMMRRRDPNAENPGGRAETLAENFVRQMNGYEKKGKKPQWVEGKLKTALGALDVLNNYLTEYDYPENIRRAIKATIETELRAVQASFERGWNWRFVLTFTDDVPAGFPVKGNPLVKLEWALAHFLFQLEELRNGAKEDNYAYTVTQLRYIYACLHSLVDEGVGNIKSEPHTTVEGEIGGDL